MTGATRGAGLGIARVLGEEGATVYVTGRSVRGAPTVPEYPGGVEDAADQVSGLGGHGIPVRCDHTDEQAVDRLFQQVSREPGRLDVLVCNAWAGYMPYPEHNDWFAQPFWEQSMDRWDGMFTGGLRAHLLTARYGLPLMVPARRGLVVFTTFTMGRKYLGNVFYDVAKNGICRAAEVLAGELEEHEIAVLALTPGWVLAERMIRPDRPAAGADRVTGVHRPGDRSTGRRSRHHAPQRPDARSFSGPRVRIYRRWRPLANRLPDRPVRRQVRALSSNAIAARGAPHPSPEPRHSVGSRPVQVALPRDEPGFSSRWVWW